MIPKFIRAKAEYLTNYNPESQLSKDISPEKFLKLAPQMTRSEIAICKIKHRLQNKLEIDPLFLEISPSGKVLEHEGRHRATAAKELGISKVPVIFFCKADDGYSSYIDKNECSKIVSGF